MKLKIKRGESVKDAIWYLRNFIFDLEQSYSYLRSDMTIYLNLEGPGRKNCPENDKEYTLTADGPICEEENNKIRVVEGQIDYESLEVIKKKGELKSDWVGYENQMRGYEAELDWIIGIKQNELDSLEEKDRESEAYKQKLKELQEDKVQLRVVSAWNEYLKTLNEMFIKNEGVEWYFTKKDNVITAYLIFLEPKEGTVYFMGDADNIEGGTFKEDCKKIHWGLPGA